MLFRETPVRSVLKALSWRVLGTMVTAGLVYATTGRLLLALGIGGVEWVLKLGFYFVHERVWNMIETGKREIPPGA
jgi:adenylylsulfate kinase